jgi:hypothetical protein
MTATRPIDPTAHTRHDPALIAALADRDATAALGPAELATARDQLQHCAECAALHRDLLDLMVGLQVASTPTRPRDFRLTTADAERLQPRGLRRLLRSIGSARDTVTRPLAIGLTTLGLVGVLAGTVPGALPLGDAASGGSDPVTTMAGEGAGQTLPSDAAAPADGSPVTPGSTQILEMATEDPNMRPDADGYVFNGAEFEQATRSDDVSREAEAPVDVSLREDPTGLSAMAVIAGTMLIVGLGLFALRWSSRRFG